MRPHRTRRRRRRPLRMRRRPWRPHRTRRRRRRPHRMRRRPWRPHRTRPRTRQLPLRLSRSPSPALPLPRLLLRRTLRRTSSAVGSRLMAPMMMPRPPRLDVGVGVRELAARAAPPRPPNRATLEAWPTRVATGAVVVARPLPRMAAKMVRVTSGAVVVGRPLPRIAPAVVVVVRGAGAPDRAPPRRRPHGSARAPPFERWFAKASRSSCR